MNATALLALSGAAGASEQPSWAIHDLPSHWEGVAGNLVARVPMSLTIQRINKIRRDDKSPRAGTTYEVDAQIRSGHREMAVTEISIFPYAEPKYLADCYLHINDELTPKLFGVLMYDETSNTYTFKDVERGGQRAFSLSAPARHDRR